MHLVILRQIVRRPPFVAGRPHPGPRRQLSSAPTEGSDPATEATPDEPCVCFQDPRWSTPLTFAEQAARLAAHQRWVEEMKNIPDDPNEDDRDFFRAMDAGREFPLFEGMY